MADEDTETLPAPDPQIKGPWNEPHSYSPHLGERLKARRKRLTEGARRRRYQPKQEE